MTLVDILINSARQYPNHPALTMKRGYRVLSLTYAQWYEMAKQVAVFLARNGIQPGQSVALLAPNSPYWGVVFFGSLLRGCHAVPLNVQSTRDMAVRAIEQTESKILFKHVLFKEPMPDGVAVFDIDFLDELVADCKASDYQPHPISQDDLVQILYTSGTTGDPKGAMLTHHNLVSNVLAISALIPATPGKDRILSILPLSHILEQTAGFFLPLHKGIEIVYAHTPAAIAPLMKKYHITKMIAVPEFLQIIRSRITAHIHGRWFEKPFNGLLSVSQTINRPWLARILFYPLLRQFGGKLDTMASGGAPLSADLEQWWNNLGVRILQGYGLTETSPIVTINTYDKHRFFSVGAVLPGVQVLITSDGEILIKGPNVFKGYYKNPDKTRDAFTTDGWFKTGDMGIIDAGGFVFLRGRKKYMILGPGGQNVFPEDIEDALNQIPGIKDSAVIGIEKDHTAVEIHASLLLTTPNIDPAPLVARANEKLASYQQIDNWSIWPDDDFPRSATRKVKKEIVRQYIQSTAPQTHRAPAATVSPLTKILSQVSGIPTQQITVDAQLGRDLHLDSLKRVELAARIEQDIHVVIDETLLTATVTAQQLQELIDKRPTVKPIRSLASWPRWTVIRILRFFLQELFFLISRLFLRVHVKGLDNLKNLTGPIIIMPNHASYWDGVVVARALPLRWRWRLSFAAAQDVVYEEFNYVSWLAELAFNCFPLPRQEGENIKTGLENAGQMLDTGYHLVVFPEGKMSLDGKQLPFKEGAGLFATQMNAPVILVHIDQIQKIFPYDAFLPRHRGSVAVTIGKPMTFSRRTSYQETKRILEDTLKQLEFQTARSKN